MRVLILGPDHAGGSLPPYLNVLAAGLRHHGITVDRHGSTQLPYAPDQHRFWPLPRVRTAVRALADQIDWDAYDVVSLHFGNLEYDQLVVALWADRPRPPVVYHVHTLAPTLLRDHVPDPHWNHVVRQGIRSVDGYVYFGQYARHRLARMAADGVPGEVAWLPTTIPAGTEPTARAELATALDTTGLPVISLYGYAAPWQDAVLLHAALERMQAPARIVLAGDFWDDPEQAGIDLSGFTTSPARVGVGELAVVPGYLGPADRAALVRASAAGVFPYRPHPSFQGSGAIADYLAHAVPVVAPDVANMAELAGSAGHIVPTGDPEALAAALDTITSGVSAANLARNATARAERFTAETHATRCLAIYRQVLDQDRRTTA